MQPLRILHVSEAFGGGLLGVVAELARRLADDGHTVAVAHGRRPETPADVPAALGPGIEVFALGWDRRTPAEQLRAARALRRLVRSWEPDVVHLHSSFAGVVGAVALPSGVPTVYSPHGYSFSRSSDGGARRRAYLTAERFVARRIDMLGGVSDSEADQARRIVGAPRVCVVCNGIPELDPGQLPAPVADRDRLIVGMGRADAQRQPDAAGRILARVRDVAEVRWIGGGTPTDEGIRVLESHGVPVTGWLEPAAAKAQLGRALAFLHWSAWDGQPLAILEAMARDVVVVASDIPANRDLVGPRQVCSTEDEAVELLRGVVEDPALREELLDEQRARRDRYSTRRMTDDWEAVYRRLLAREPASAPTRRRVRGVVRAGRSVD
ncbi:MAG TPA: glycosyltransferase family 4 protein [Capillimicrobium sp.]|jgi:glycosyltransferase involved in cell wall biosynthesis